MCISYVEVPNMQDNIPAVLEIIKYIYENIMYAELNTKSDYCQKCGYDGEIKIVTDENGKLIWQCPKCGNTDQDTMNVARRTCGGCYDLATISNDRNSGKLFVFNKDNRESSSNNFRKCDVCGRIGKNLRKINGNVLCQKHYNQIKKYGKVLENSPRTIYDKNNISVAGKVAYIDLYDKLYNVVAQAIIDKEDLPKVQFTKWRINSSGYVINNSNRKASTIFLHRRILNTNHFVDHINGNRLDNRKCNLRIVTKSQNQMNINYQGVSVVNNKYYAHIKINQKMINLGVYIDKDEALYARWYAEKILFKEFRYPKTEPFILPTRKIEIEQYVNKRINKYISHIA